MACPDLVLDGCDFAQFLVDQQPHYDQEIIQKMQPIDSGWLNRITTGYFPAGAGVEMYQDTFERVHPNVFHPWERVGYASCGGDNPCDPKEYEICYGNTRRSFYLLRQSWRSPLQCFDQQFHISHAKEHWDDIVAKILRPATTEIQNQFIRAWALEYAGKRYCACAGLPEFDYGLQADANGDYTILCTSQRPTSLLTPGMLQYAYGPLLLDGYFGESPFQGKANLPLAALVTDLDTCWLLQHLNHDAGVGGTPSIADNWRFTQWDAANEYWRYGLSGQIGNFAVEVDALAPRFNYMDQNGPADTPYRFQAVTPYLPAAATHGIKNIPNPDYQTAQVRGTFIWHKSALQLQTAETTAINPEMPFLKRNLAGKWWFAMHDLGDDCNGRAIDNTRLNKGIWKADFQQAVRPRHTEWTRFFLHLSQPPVITIVPPTVTSQGYPEQDYNCACEDCGNCP